MCTHWLTPVELEASVHRPTGRTDQVCGDFWRSLPAQHTLCLLAALICAGWPHGHRRG